MLNSLDWDIILNETKETENLSEIQQKVMNFIENEDYMNDKEADNNVDDHVMEEEEINEPIDENMKYDENEHEHENENENEEHMYEKEIDNNLNNNDMGEENETK